MTSSGNFVALRTIIASKSFNAPSSKSFFLYAQELLRDQLFQNRNGCFRHSIRHSNSCHYRYFRRRPSMNILQLGPSQRYMATTLDIGNLMWAIGILLLPLILAVPAKILYQTVILGVGPAERNYRSTVQKILDSGMQVEQFREVLDEEARRLGLKASRAKLNETDMLYPLSLTHFLLLVPMIFILPIIAVLSLPIIIMGIPVLYILEVLLIRRRVPCQCNQTSRDMVRKANNTHSRCRQRALQ